MTEMFYLSGVYIGCLLNGERPANLPVQQATEVELIINLKTAKMLGLTVPPSLFGRADRSAFKYSEDCSFSACGRGFGRRDTTMSRRDCERRDTIGASIRPKI